MQKILTLIVRFSILVWLIVQLLSLSCHLASFSHRTYLSACLKSTACTLSATLTTSNFWLTWSSTSPSTWGPATCSAPLPSIRNSLLFAPLSSRWIQLEEESEQNHIISAITDFFFVVVVCFNVCALTLIGNKLSSFPGVLLNFELSWYLKFLLAW